MPYKVVPWWDMIFRDSTESAFYATSLSEVMPRACGTPSPHDKDDGVALTIADRVVKRVKRAKITMFTQTPAAPSSSQKKKRAPSSSKNK